MRKRVRRAYGSMDVNALAWQLRSGCLRLDGERVALQENSLQTASEAVRRVVQQRADKINEILAKTARHFDSIEAVADYFRKEVPNDITKNA